MSLQIYLRRNVLSWSSNQQNADPSSRVHWMVFFTLLVTHLLTFVVRVSHLKSCHLFLDHLWSLSKIFFPFLYLVLPLEMYRKIQKDNTVFSLHSYYHLFTHKKDVLSCTPSRSKKCFLIRSQTTQSKHPLTNFQLSNLFDLLLCLREFFIFGGQFQLNESFSLLSQHLLCMLPVTVWTHTFLEACLCGYHKLQSLSWFDFTVSSR